MGNASGFAGSRLCQRLAACFTAALLLSCSAKPDSDVAKLQTSLGQQTTFTLSAPNGMSPLAPALESANSLTVGAFAKVNPSAPVVAMGATGTTRIDPDAKLNDLWSRGPADLRDRVTINGWVHAKTLTLGNNVNVNPAKIDRSPVFDPVAKLSWVVTFPSTTPQDVTLSNPAKISIVPGYYGNVLFNSTTAELTLQSGTYYIDSLTLNSTGKVWLDQANGPVIIYVKQVNAFRGAFAALDGSSPDLFVGYTGANQLFVETNFKGSIVAPNAKLTLRSVSSPHVGFFAGKDVELDANAVVSYGTPNPILVASGPDETTCRKLVPLRSDLSGNAQLIQYAKDVARYCGGCRSSLDSDLDTVVDCIDECPYDPLKTKPGIAGCGASDQNTDGDKVPDGIDQCDQDPRNVAPGDCGCVGQDNKKPAGTLCFDPICPGQTNPVCDGSGVCGSTNCKPQVDCFPVVFRGHAYHFCGGGVPSGPAVPKNETGAYNACTAQGLAMARVDTYEQNSRIQALLRSFNIGEAWLGGNQLATANAWRWAKLGNLSGDQFWSGGASGSRVNGSFALWALGQPGAGKCAAMQSSDGRWIAKDCATSLPFVCENPPVPGGGGIGPGGGGSIGPAISGQPQPLSANCVPEYSGPAPLPGKDQLPLLLDQHTQAGNGVFTGAASNPPPVQGATCPTSSAENCPLTNIKTLLCADGVHECDCAGENARRLPSKGDICAEKFGTGYQCLAAKLDPNCKAVNASDPDCATRAVCGVRDCSGTAPDFPNRCDQIDICPKGASDTFTFTQPDSASDLNGQNVTPSAFFDRTPSMGQSGSYQDEPNPARTGKDHVWCQLGPQDPNKVSPADTDMDKGGSSGGGSPIKVSFKPDLIFSANPNPLAFGETNMGLNAQARMSASVDLSPSVLAPSGVGIEVFSAGIGITAERCKVSTDETALKVFEQNIDIHDYIPIFDTDDLEATKAFGRECKSGIGNYIVKADRMKKAFRDAQQLIKQYKTIKAGNGKFDANFCRDLGILDLGSKNFPLAGVCPEDETPEMTINRFIDYYQRDKLGEIQGLREAMQLLAKSTTSLRSAIIQALDLDDGAKITIPFVDFKRSENKTLVKTPFAIGPVPMLLEIGVTAGYGVSGNFNMSLQFPADLDHSIGDLNNPDAPNPAQIAGVNATVEPWASAGMTVFVGANFGIGSVGIEGGVTLAKISAPISAGVGLALATIEDTRIVPTDIQSAASYIGNSPQYVFGPPKAMQFYLTFQYGASIDLADVLAGEVNGRLTIDFWLFSRTWRKRIVKFNGWSKRFPLINPSGAVTYVPIVGTGRGTNTAESNNSGMGRAESPLPFVFLEKLFEPHVGSGAPTGAAGSGGAGGGGGAGGSGGVPTTSAVDKSKVEQFSYDTLCCAKQGEACSISNRPGCCEPFACKAAADSDTGTCEPKPAPQCAQQNQACGFDAALGVDITCCSGDACPKSGVCPAAACIENEEPCELDAGLPCCHGECHPYFLVCDHSS